MTITTRLLAPPAPPTMTDPVREPTIDELISISREFLALGLRLTPNGNHRRPLIEAWPNRASSGPAVVERWIRRLYGVVGLGMVVGDDQSPLYMKRKLRVVTLDIDKPGAADVLGTLPPTMTVKTPKGLHLSYLTDREIFGCNKLCEGLDVKGIGGAQVPVPGSFRVCEDGRLFIYERTNDLPMAMLPAEAADTIDRLFDEREARLRVEREARRAEEREKFFARTGGQRVATATEQERFALVLAEVCAEIRSARPGSRHDTINGAAYRLGLHLYAAPDREAAIEAVLEAYAEVHDDVDRRDEILQAIADGERDAQPRVSPWAAGLWSREPHTEPVRRRINRFREGPEVLPLGSLIDAERQAAFERALQPRHPCFGRGA